MRKKYQVGTIHMIKKVSAAAQTRTEGRLSGTIWILPRRVYSQEKLERSR